MAMDDGVSKHTLLLVDADPKSLRVLEVSLKKAGFSVITAGNGVEALARLEHGAPELIISDTHMPQMDGFELCRRVKERAAWTKIPFVFLSSRKSIEDKIRGLELGVEDYLYKPIYIKEITTRVRILLQRQQREHLESHRDTRTRFAGQLSDIGVVDLVQTIDVNKKSGVVHIANVDGRRGGVFFRDGRVIDAEAGRLSGLEAAYRLFTWSEGSFEVEFRKIHRPDVIELSGQALLMEGMRRLDEWTRLCETLPPLSTVLEVNYFVLAERLGEIPDEVNRVLRLFDGRRSFLQVIEDSDFPDLEAASIVGRLLADRVVYQADAERGPAPPETTTGRLERWLAESPWANLDRTPIPEPVDVVGPASDSPTLPLQTLGATALMRSMSPAPRAPMTSPAPRAPMSSPAPRQAAASSHPGSSLQGQTMSGFARSLGDPRSSTPGGGPDLRKDRIITSPYGMPAIEDEARARIAAEALTAELNAAVAEAGRGRVGTPRDSASRALAEHDLAHGPTDTFVARPPARETPRAPQAQTVVGDDMDPRSRTTAPAGGADADAISRSATSTADGYAAVSPLEVGPAITARAGQEALEEDEEDEDEETRGEAEAEEPSDEEDEEDDEDDEEDEESAESDDEESDDDQDDEEDEEGDDDAQAEDRGGTSLLDAAPVPKVRRAGSARLGTPVPSYADLGAHREAAYSDTLKVEPVRRPWALWIAGTAIGLAGGLIFYLGRGPRPGAEGPAKPEAAVVEPGASVVPVPPPAVDLPAVNLPEHAPVGAAVAPVAGVVPVGGAGGTASTAPVAAKPEAAAGDVATLEKECKRAFSRGRHAEITTVCGRLLAARPRDAKAMVMLASAELDNGDVNKALSWAKQAIAIDAKQADAYVFIGGGEQELGHKKAARAAYEKYLQLAPNGRYAGDLRVIIEGL